jgi:flavin-dependent dehydrogenase
MNKNWNVVIIGAGPAGSMLACELASIGVSDILLLDKAVFPRQKVCGCCLNAAALDQLEQAGLLGPMSLLDHGVPLHSLHVYLSGRRVAINLPAGLAISRESFDQLLVLQAVRRGVTFRDGCAARVGTLTDGYRLVHLAAGDDANLPTAAETLTARVVIAADGLGGTSLQGFSEFSLDVYPHSKVGVGTRVSAVPAGYIRNTVFMSCANHGYAGIVALEDGTCDVAAALDVDLLRDANHDIGGTVQKIMREAGLPIIEALNETRWRGTRPLTCKRKDVASCRIFVVGDSAAYVEPFTGEGIAWALAGARALTPIVRKCVREGWDDLLSAQWRYMHRRIVRDRQATSKLAAFALRNTRSVGVVSRLLEGAPFVLHPLVARVNAPIEVR